MSSVAAENVCLVNPALGYGDPANVYECKPPLKCCTEFSKPSCCGSKPSWKIIQEQITLWGGLFAILLAIASIVYCRKNDLNVPACVALKRSAIRLCCGGGSSGDHHLNEGEGGGHGEEDTEMALKQHSRRGEATGASHGWRNNTVNPLVIEMSHV